MKPRGSSDALVFEEPAAPRDARALTGWRALLGPLLDRPNTWARVKLKPKDAALKLASQLRCRNNIVLPPGRWEFTASPVAGRDEWGVYARYVGPDDGSAPERASAKPKPAAGAPTCARKGCDRPAGKGATFCVPQRWCRGEKTETPAPSAPAALKKGRGLEVPKASGLIVPKLPPAKPLEDFIEDPEPEPTRLMERYGERTGRRG